MACLPRQPAHRRVARLRYYVCFVAHSTLPQSKDNQHIVLTPQSTRSHTKSSSTHEHSRRCLRPLTSPVALSRCRTDLRRPRRRGTSMSRCTNGTIVRSNSLHPRQLHHWSPDVYPSTPHLSSSCLPLLLCRVSTALHKPTSNPPSLKSSYTARRYLCSRRKLQREFRRDGGRARPSADAVRTESKVGVGLRAPSRSRVGLCR